jgi:hypothetical protein
VPARLRDHKNERLTNCSLRIVAKANVPLQLEPRDWSRAGSHLCRVSARLASHAVKREIVEPVLLAGLAQSRKALLGSCNVTKQIANGCYPLDESDTHAIYEAARNEDHSVDCTDGETSLLRSCIKPRLIPMAGIDPGEEKRAKEQDLGREEQPHPSDCCFRLMRRA